MHSYILLSQQVADVLTKRLLKSNFDFGVSKLGLIDIYIPTWGWVLELVDFTLGVFLESKWKIFPIS